jgi:hypothetical protein
VQRVRALVGTLEPIGVPVHAIAHQARRPVLPVSIAMVPLLAMTVHTATIGGASRRLRIAEISPSTSACRRVSAGFHWPPSL